MKKMIKIIGSVAALCGAIIMMSLTISAEAVTTVPKTTSVVSSEKTILGNTLPNNQKNEMTISSKSEEKKSNTPDVTGSIEGKELTVPSGNGILLEDNNNDVVDRQFLTIQSKNGNTFYIIVDKDSTGKENVYFLNMVDEYDLMAFAENFPEDDKEGKIKASTSDKKDKPDVTDLDGNTVEDSDLGDKESELESESPEESSSSGQNNMLVPVVGVLAIAGGAAFYFLKVKDKPKNEKKSDFDDEDEDFDDDTTVNEDDE